MKLKWLEKAKKIVSSVLFLQMLFALLVPAMTFAAAPTIFYIDKNDSAIPIFRTSDSTPTITGGVDTSATSITITINTYSCTTTPVSGGWSCDGAFITTPLTANVVYPISWVASNADGFISGTDATGVVYDTIAPVISENMPVITPTNDTTPRYEFNVDSTSAITYGGDCSSPEGQAYATRQQVDFNTLSDGLYSNCTIFVTDRAGNVSNTITVSPFTVDTTGPTLDPVGFKYATPTNTDWVGPLTGDLASGWNLDRDGNASTNYYLDFTDTTVADENIMNQYFPLYISDLVGVTAPELVVYYVNRGVPEPFLTYLTDAANNAGPFAYIKGIGSSSHPTLIDGAKHDILAIDEPMAIPGDFPEGEYTVSGVIGDVLGNASTTYDFKLIIGDITAPVISGLTTISTPSANTTPSFDFDSDEEGTLNISGSGCTVSSFSVVAGSNTFTFDSLSDGTYDCSITVTDDADNVSNSLSLDQFVVDTTAPATTYAITGGTAGNSGWYKGVTPPTITLSTESTATIHWQWESEGWNSGLTDQTPAVTEGERTIEYYSVDIATNEESPHKTATVKYDATAPTGTVVINSDATWAKSVDATLTLSASDGLSGVSQMLIANNTSYQGPFTYVPGSYAWTLNSNEGTKTVRVKYIDAAGNEMAVGTPDTIKLDTTAPRVTNLEVVDPDAGLIPYPDMDPYAVGDHMIRVRAEVYDDLGINDSGLNISSCQITVDGSNWTQFSAWYNAGKNRCVGDIPANYFSDGQLVSGFNVRVSDVAGNIGVGVGTGRIIDSLAPVLDTMTVTPRYMDTVAGTINAESVVTENPSASGVANCEQRYWLNLYDGDSSDDWSDWVTTTYADGKCQISMGGLQDGRIYQFEFRATDNVGHVSNIASSGPVLVDDIAPTVTFVDPTLADGVSTAQNSQTFKIETDSDADSCSIDLGLGSGTFEDGTLTGWTTGGTVPWVISSDAYTGSYSAKSGNLAWRNGVNSWIYKTVDVPFNTTIDFDWKVSSESGYDYLSFYLDNNQLNAMSGEIGWTHLSYPISAGSHTIKWYYSKDGSVTSEQDSGWIDNVAISGVDLGLLNGDMVDNGDGTWSYGPVTLPDGPRSYTVTCVDQVGNTTTTGSRSLTIDTTAPSIPGTPTPNRTDPTKNQWVTWSWGASTDLYSGIDHYEWVIQKDRVQVASGNVASDVTNKNKSLTWGDGEYVFLVRAVDGLGNTSEYSFSDPLTLDQTSPVAPSLDWPYDPYYTQDQTITFDWVSVDDAYRYRIEFCAEDPGDAGDVCNSVIDEKMGVSNTYKTYTFSSSDMNVWWRVRTRDEAGNLSPWGESRKVVIDNTAPVSSVDTLAQYINTEKFNINITANDLAPTLNINNLVKANGLIENQGSGVDYIELWYRKDKTDVNIADLSRFAEMPANGYTRYCTGTPEAALYAEDIVVDDGSPCYFDPTQPIEFDTTLTGGDGFYEFYSIAVDNAGNREIVPMTGLPGLYPLLEEGVIIGAEVLPDTSTTVDTKSPVITLIGNSPMTVTQGTIFTDPGASTDDGTAVVQSGSVDTNVVGSYLRYYDATDLAGNVADQVTRTVNVIAAPVLLSPLATTVGGDTGLTEEVLGATDENVDGQEKEVKGSEDTNTEDKNSDTKTDGTFLGLMWYWWVLIVAGLVGGWWWFAAWRRRREED